ncbi:MAG: NIPSNAP family containing protein [Marivirga sp.]|nr:NIPSNAP family containing protein [Marivirga sp.]
MKHILLVIFCTISVSAISIAPKREYYEIKIYTIKDKSQEEKVDKFLKDAFLPALHRAGIGKVGVFKPVETDTTYGKRIYVFIPYSSMDQFTKLPEMLQKDKQYESAGREYLTAPFDNPPYVRIQSILLLAFTGMPRMEAPKLTSPVSERIYELRSYEGHTEKIFKNKVQMFNAGDEVGLFKRLGFNALFYAEVLSGSRMPNLMYMTTFENKASRDEHWKAFSSDPQWKKLSALPEYQHNVSKIDTFFLHPTEYSDI